MSSEEFGYEPKSGEKSPKRLDRFVQMIKGLNRWRGGSSAPEARSVPGGLEDIALLRQTEGSLARAIARDGENDESLNPELVSKLRQFADQVAAAVPIDARRNMWKHIDDQNLEATFDGRQAGVTYGEIITSPNSERMASEATDLAVTVDLGKLPLKGVLLGLVEGIQARRQADIDKDVGSVEGSWMREIALQRSKDDPGVSLSDMRVQQVADYLRDDRHVSVVVDIGTSFDLQVEKVRGSKGEKTNIVKLTLILKDFDGRLNNPTVQEAAY